MEREVWLCPFCKTELEYWETMVVETLVDHVCDPNGPGSAQSMVKCSNPECYSNQEEVQMRWDTYGDSYTFGTKYEVREDKAIGKNVGPFGSVARKSGVEIYRNGVKKETWFKINPCWLTFNLGIFGEYQYQADYDGNVLKKSIKWKRVKKEKDGAIILYPTIFHDICQKLKWFYSDRRYFFKDPKGSFSQDELLKHYEAKLPEWDTRFYRKFCKWWVNTFYIKTFRKLQFAMGKHSIAVQWAVDDLKGKKSN